MIGYGIVQDTLWRNQASDWRTRATNCPNQRSRLHWMSSRGSFSMQMAPSCKCRRVETSMAHQRTSFFFTTSRC